MYCFTLTFITITKASYYVYFFIHPRLPFKKERSRDRSQPEGLDLPTLLITLTFLLCRRYGRLCRLCWGRTLDTNRPNIITALEPSPSQRNLVEIRIACLKTNRNISYSQSN